MYRVTDLFSGSETDEIPQKFEEHIIDTDETLIRPTKHIQGNMKNIEKKLKNFQSFSRSYFPCKRV